MNTDVKINKKKLLVFIVAYNAENTIANVLTRIPNNLSKDYEISILIIDDASNDKTFDISKNFRDKKLSTFPITILKNPINQGYGGNQKLDSSMQLKIILISLLLFMETANITPECLNDLLLPFDQGLADVVFGSRMMTRFGALKGRMHFINLLVTES